MKMQKRLKIAFFCDMNNVLLTVAYGLHLRGHLVRYLPSLKLNQHFRVFDIFHNCNAKKYEDCTAFISFEDFSVALNHDTLLELGSRIKNLQAEGYLIIGADYAPLLAEYVGIKLDSFVVTGSDLINSPRKPSLLTRFLSRLKRLYLQQSLISPTLAANLQMMGIVRASHILTHSEGYFKLSIKEVANLPRAVVPYPICFEDHYDVNQNISYEKHLVEKYVQKLREKTDYICLLMSKIDPIKGTHIFVDGFYDFVTEINSKAILIVPGRGRFNLVYNTNARFRELINTGNIHIIPPVSQAAVYSAFAIVDVSLGLNCGDFTLHDWNTTLMQSLQALCPLVTYQPFDTLCDTGTISSYPHFNAKDRKTVKHGLVFYSDSKHREEARSNIRLWNKYMREKSIDMWESILQGMNP